MTGDKAVAIVCIFTAGFLAGEWSTKQEKKPPAAPASKIIPAPCVVQLPESRKAARRWAQSYLAAGREAAL